MFQRWRERRQRERRLYAALHAALGDITDLEIEVERLRKQLALVREVTEEKPMDDRVMSNGIEREDWPDPSAGY